MNKVLLIGNLTRDPERSETQNGTSVCHFAIAVNRNYTDGNGERQADFFNVTCWRGLAESVAEYCKKGSKVAVSGSVQMRHWEDNKGNKRDAVDIIAQEVEFLSTSYKDNNVKNKEQENEWEGYNEACKEHEKRFNNPSLQSFDDDGDIPF